MSIKIDKATCVACGKCLQVCPGNLLTADETKKAYIKFPQECWGCTACLKECRVGAIKYFLGADIGGKGTFLYTKVDKDCLHWHFIRPDGEKVISINKKESNKY
jgi:adenylylsulfate reductase, subunit B